MIIESMVNNKTDSLISKQKVLNLIRMVMTEESVSNALLYQSVSQMDSEEPKQGHWIEHKWAEEVDGMLISNYECSECHYWGRHDSNFCPNCGVRMVNENE